MAFDFKKEFKEYYRPGKRPSIVDVPKFNYIAVRGRGDPNEEDSEYKTSPPPYYIQLFSLLK